MRSTFLINVAIILVALAQGKSIDSSTHYEFMRQMKLSDEVSLTWYVNTGIQSVVFVVVAKTMGWIGFGISNTGSMTNADLVIGGYDGVQPYIGDYHSSANGMPVKDALQNWNLIDAFEDETEGTTTLRFGRLLDTSDAIEDIRIQDANIYLIWAIGADDDVARMHIKRGSLVVNILEDPAQITTTESEFTSRPTTDFEATSRPTTDITDSESTLRPTTDSGYSSRPTTDFDYTSISTVESESTLGSTTEGYEGIDFVRTEALSNLISVTWHVYFSIEKIIFEVHAKTTGYVGFGISDTATMANADMIVGGVLEDTTPYFSDRHSGGHGEPIVDTSQDWDYLEAVEEANQTYLRFIRKFNTNDYKEDIEITYRDTNFIWALGSSDELTMHATRGSYGVNILDSNIRENFNRTEKIGENITVTWSVHFDTQKVTFEVLATTTGYVGFGFSDSGSMANSDLIIGGLTSDFTPYFTDRHFNNTAWPPSIDTEQNWVLLAVREQQDQTYIRFMRDFFTGDDIEDLPILDKQVNFIWALGDSDEIEYNKLSGTFPVNILRAA